MRLPISTVSLHNIDDAAGFVIDALRRSGVPAAEHEREDLIADGLAMLCDWADRWRPEEYGDGTGSFAGYAYQYLPQRLKDAWHQQHPEHSYRTTADGTRRYEYGEPALSIFTPTGVMDVVGSTHIAEPDDTPLFAAALPHVPLEFRIAARPVIAALHEGYSPDEAADQLNDIAKRLGMTKRHVRDVIGAVASAHHQTKAAAA